MQCMCHFCGTTNPEWGHSFLDGYHVLKSPVSGKLPLPVPNKGRNNWAMQNE